MRDKSFKRYLYIAVSMFGVVALSIFLFFFLYNFDNIGAAFKHVIATLMPFIVGAVLAYIMCPLCNVFEKFLTKVLKKYNDGKRKKKIISGVSVFGAITVAMVAIYLILMILIPQLIESIVKIVQILPASVDGLLTWLQGTISSNETLLTYAQQIIDKGYQYIENWLSNGLLEYVENFATGLSTGVISIIGIFMNIFVGAIVAVYLLLSRKKLARQAKLITYSIFKKNIADEIVEEAKFADKVFSGFINGKIIDALIVSCICYLGMMIFRAFNPGKDMMSEILVSVIVGIFNVIPFFGWYIGLFLSALLILIVNPVQCIFFIIFDFILQQIDGNILGPKILGNTTGISSLWVLFSIFLFGDIWGFAGMLIGVPLFAVIYQEIKRLVFIGLRRRGQEEMIKEYNKDYPDDGITADYIDDGKLNHSDEKAELKDDKAEID